jgi:hypothetical protein
VEGQLHRELTIPVIFKALHAEGGGTGTGLLISAIGVSETDTVRRKSEVTHDRLPYIARKCGTFASIVPPFVTLFRVQPAQFIESRHTVLLQS